MVALNYLSPTVGKNSHNLGDDCISMTSSDTGSCSFYTTNTNEFTFLELVCSNKTQQAQAPYVNFKRFKGIIASIAPTEYITIKEGAPNEIWISFSMRKTPIKLQGNTNGMIQLPNIATNLPPVMTEIPLSFFSNIITKASTIIQESNTVPILNCVKLSIGNPEVTAEAIDVASKRTFMMKDSFGTSANPVEFYIEAGKMASSIRLFEDFTDVEAATDGSVTVLKGGTRPALYNRKHGTASNDILSVMYFMRSISGTFPSVSQYYSNAYYPLEFISVSKEDLINSIARIKAIGDDTSFSSGIMIKADKKEFNMSFSSQYGNLEDSVDVYNTLNTPINMLFNHKQFEEVIRCIDTEYIDIGLMQQTQSNFVVKASNAGNTGQPYSGTDVFSILSLNMQQQTP